MKKPDENIARFAENLKEDKRICKFIRIYSDQVELLTSISNTDPIKLVEDALKYSVLTVDKISKLRG